MLLLSLKSGHRQLNHGEFAPRLSTRRRKTRADFLRLPDSGNWGLAALDSVPAEARTQRSPSRQSSTLSPSPPKSRETAGSGFGTQRPQSSSRGLKLLKEHKIFSNRNSYNGTWLDGRMHGEGLYTWSDSSEYAGEFHEGYMWGEGEKKWPNGRKYRGEWQRDMMWGDGEMTWPSGETFRGQFRKGIFHGKGTRIWPTGDVYTGEFKNGEQEGDGTFESAADGWVYNGRWLHGRMFGDGRVQWPSGIRYVGEWKDGVREGLGRLTWPDGAWYEGQFRKNCIEGRGRKALPDGSWFDGNFHDGELEGHGTFHWPDGTEFEGLWHDSQVVGPGCHRLPDDTTITGVFDDRGATGEGTKCWASGCVFTGTLLKNQIHHQGVLKWPDGRSYVGQFQDEMMHGDGMLTWSDREGLCRYKGRFQRNLFHGDGVLEWSSKARYAGEFADGHYHGEGTFEWPDRLNVYRGQWENGEMSGRGILTTNGEMVGPAFRRGDPLVYVGDFRGGNMEGRGHATFVLAGGLRDQYKGEWKGSMFNGHGTFSWSTGHSLTGFFQDNHCSQVGEKVYPGGQIYMGELRMDLEHGKGVLQEADHRVIGLWQDGNCVEELVEAFVPALDLDSVEGEEWQRVFVTFRSADEPVGGRPQLKDLKVADSLDPEVQASTDVSTQREGEAVVLFLNGDKYVGHIRDGKKHGQGMYVYADLTAYKGQWADDAMHSQDHPLKEQDRTGGVRQLHNLNEENQRNVEALKMFTFDNTRS